MAVEELVPTLESPERITRSSSTYNADARHLFLRETFSDPVTDPMFAPAIQQFWNRPYFRRGWIVQEFLLAKDIVCLAGPDLFTRQDLVDMFSMPDTTLEAQEEMISYRILIQLHLYMFTDAAPLRFLRLMSAVTAEFQTREVVDRLFCCLGLMEGLDFTPDYTVSVQQNFTRFAVTLARDYGSLDFLSLWSANLDPLLPNTPTELLGFPSWVPSWTPTPLVTPWRLITGGVRSYRSDVSWNAAAGRKHVHDQLEDAVNTRQLQVRGKVVDYVEGVSSTRFMRYWDADEEHLKELVVQIKQDLSGLEHWTPLELIRFLNVVTANGGIPENTPEQTYNFATEESYKTSSFAALRADSLDLGLGLTMGRGRRFARTEKGDLGLVPAVGSQARSGKKRGSAVVVLHGCIVPLILESVDEAKSEWKVIGDCYIESIMLGEAVKWEEVNSETFILV